MKRLTIRLEDGQAVMDCDTCSRSRNICTLMACRNRLKDRLCDYEDVMQQYGLLVKQKHGRWVHDINNLYGCSECGGRETMSHKKKKNYCPHCGAKMDGGNVDGCQKKKDINTAHIAAL